MPSIYTASPVGATVRLPGSSSIATFSLIEVKGKEKNLGLFKEQKAIVTSWSFEENVNVQFTHTMGNDIYVNVFGNRMAVLVVNGITFSSTATVGADEECTDDHGVNHIIKWYRDNRVSNPDAPERIKVTIAGGAEATVIDGFLVNASYRANDPVSWTVEYTMQIAVIPK